MSESTNFHVVESPEQFKELLSADLDRVSLINFWASWAEPCKQMNDFLQELAKKHPKLLVLQVDAEGQEEISESFNIEAVPTVIVLRGHTLLDRISGADAAKVTTSVAKHLAGGAVAAKVTASVAKHVEVSLPVDSQTPKREETWDELAARMRGIMKQSKVVLFMKGEPDSPRCGFSRKAVGLLRDNGVAFTHFDILEDDAVRQGLKKLNNWPTYPQFIVDGELVGGLDVVQEVVETGEFAETFGAA